MSRGRAGLEFGPPRFRPSGVCDFWSGGAFWSPPSGFSGCVFGGPFFSRNAGICGLFAARPFVVTAFSAFRFSCNFTSGGVFSVAFSGFSGSLPRGRCPAPEAGIRGFFALRPVLGVAFSAFRFAVRRAGGTGSIPGLRGTSPGRAVFGPAQAAYDWSIERILFLGRNGAAGTLPRPRRRALYLVPARNCARRRGAPGAEGTIRIAYAQAAALVSPFQGSRRLVFRNPGRRTDESRLWSPSPHGIKIVRRRQHRDAFGEVA